MDLKTKIDWYTVEYLYPLSFEHFKKKMFPNTGLICIQLLNFFETRQLYAFFDREGIYLNTEIVGGRHQWSSTTHFSNGTTLSNPGTFFTREEVEVSGFSKCFEYLEGILQSRVKKLPESY